MDTYTIIHRMTIAEKDIIDYYEENLMNVIDDLGNTTTYENQLNEYGRKLFGRRFLGVFSSDKLPRRLKSRQMYIANLDPSSQPGSHWVGAYKSGNNGKIYMYDSFGRSTSRIIPSANRRYGSGNVKDTQYDAEQKKRETNCGQRCLSALMLFDHIDPSISAKSL